MTVRTVATVRSADLAARWPLLSRAARRRLHARAVPAEHAPPALRLRPGHPGPARAADVLGRWSSSCSSRALLIYRWCASAAAPGRPSPSTVHGNTLLEIAWTIAPAIILALVAVPTVLTIYQDAGAAPPGALQVKVIGHQWWWEFQYPELGVTTANEMHVPAGRRSTVDDRDRRRDPRLLVPGDRRQARRGPGHDRTTSGSRADSAGDVPGPVRRALRHLAREHADEAHGRARPTEFEAWVGAAEGGADRARRAVARGAGQAALPPGRVRRLPHDPGRLGGRASART